MIPVSADVFLPKIGDVPLRCLRCGAINRLDDCVPCIAEDGSEGTGFGCPVPDCGGICVEATN